MSKISIYPIVPLPKLSDKLIGTSVGGSPSNKTYNFTLQELLDLFIPNIPANNLQGVLDYGNTATQDINLFGTIATTNLDVTDTSNLFKTYLNDEVHIVGSMFDSNNSIGAPGQVLSSTGTGVEWYTLPFTAPDLQQVLTEGNTSTIDIILTSNLSALDVSSDTATFSSDITINGTLTDGTASVGASGKILGSTGTGVQWVDFPSYSATSPLFLNSGTGVFSIQVANSTQDGYLSSTDWISFDGKQNALGGTGLVKSTAGTISYITDNSTNWDIAYNDTIVSAAVTGTSTKTLTLTQQDAGTVIASWADSGIYSVGLTMPSAFNVANSPLTSDGTIAVTGAGLASQYIRGDGVLADFPTGNGGGGSSVSYYLNGSVNQGTFVGNVYQQMNKTPVLGAGTDFNISVDGYIAQFITNANDPNSLLIPAGNFNLEFYFSASSSGGTPSYYVELYKYNGTTFTLIASNSANPELIAFGTTINPYFSSLAVPETILTATDRLAIRIYVNNSGKTITLHTEDTHLCQVITTFTTGVQSLNGLSKQAQYFATGSTGTDFNIVSSVDTHTFNIPSASASNRGLITTGAQTIAGAKTFNSDIRVNSINIGKGGGSIATNTRLGSNALWQNTIGTDNLALGYASLYANSEGIMNVGVGSTALYNNSLGSCNTGIGFGSLYANLEAYNNTAVGAKSLYLNDYGSDNVAVGFLSLYKNRAAANTAIGSNSLGETIDGGFNTAIGAAAGTNTNAGGLNTEPFFSVYIGVGATSASSTSSNEIVIGYSTAGNGSNTVTLGNDSITKTFLKGQVQFNSTLTDGTYTYTLPSATGTLALTSALSSYVPTSRTLTINGTTYDLSADRSWTVSSTSVMNAGTGTCSIVGSGYLNTASGKYSFAGGGKCNTASNYYTFSGGGFKNTVSGYTSTISGGYSNRSCGDWSAVVGGLCNKSNGVESFVGGGCCNTASNYDSFIGGGARNIACSSASIVVGGVRNKSCNIYSAIVGGVDNISSGDYSFIGGGNSNIASGFSSINIGGTCNVSCASDSIVVGGRCNLSSGTYSTISGGYLNISSGCNSSVLGGLCNTSSANYSGSFGCGLTNAVACSFMSNRLIATNLACAGCAVCSDANGMLVPYTAGGGGGGIIIADTGCNSTVRCGVTNCASGNYSFAGGGQCNTSSGTYSTVVGGFKNLSQGFNSFVGSGNCNQVCNSTSGCLSYGAVVAGGVGNNTTGGTWTLASCAFTVAPTICNVGSMSFIGAGFQNRSSGPCSTISGGYCNTSSGNASIISGGSCNTASGTRTSILGGQRNTASGNYSTIGGGICIRACGGRSFIGGGSCNITCNPHSTVSGGYKNTSSNYYSYIGGGQSNLSCARHTVVSGGNLNTASACYSFVGGGQSNKSCGVYSTVSGGRRNTASSYYSVVGGGIDNTACGSRSTISGGANNIASSSGVYGTIGGGKCNTASGYNSIVSGGSYNIACANFATVLGGYCNTTSSNYTGVYGCNIVNSIACSFASNQLWACNLVGTTVAVCVGTNGLLVRGASDGRLKTNICNLPYGLCDVNKLNPISFDWNEKERKNRGCNRQIGFIAQEVEPIIPEAVGQQFDNGEYSLSPDKIIPVLTKALQELSAKFDAQEKRIFTLEAIIKRNNLI
jgi:hypothetical protein